MSINAKQVSPYVADGISPRYHNGTSFVEARADNENTLATVVVVVSGTDEYFITSGLVHLEAHGLNVGEVYYLSQSVTGDAGSKPTSGLVQELFTVIDADTLLVKLETVSQSTTTTPSTEPSQTVPDVESSIVPNHNSTTPQKYFKTGNTVRVGMPVGMHSDGLVYDMLAGDPMVVGEPTIEIQRIDAQNTGTPSPTIKMSRAIHSVSSMGSATVVSDGSTTKDFKYSDGFSVSQIQFTSGDVLDLSTSDGNASDAASTDQIIGGLVNINSANAAQLEFRKVLDDSMNPGISYFSTISVTTLANNIVNVSSSPMASVSNKAYFAIASLLDNGTIALSGYGWSTVSSSYKFFNSTGTVSITPPANVVQMSMNATLNTSSGYVHLLSYVVDMLDGTYQTKFRTVTAAVTGDDVLFTVSDEVGLNESETRHGGYEHYNHITQIQLNGETGTPKHSAYAYTRKDDNTIRIGVVTIDSSNVPAMSRIDDTSPTSMANPSVTVGMNGKQGAVHVVDGDTGAQFFKTLNTEDSEGNVSFGKEVSILNSSVDSGYSVQTHYNGNTFNTEFRVVEVDAGNRTNRMRESSLVYPAAVEATGENENLKYIGIAEAQVVGGTDVPVSSFGSYTESFVSYSAADVNGHEYKDGATVFGFKMDRGIFIPSGAAAAEPEVVVVKPLINKTTLDIEQQLQNHAQALGNIFTDQDVGFRASEGNALGYTNENTGDRINWYFYDLTAQSVTLSDITSLFAKVNNRGGRKPFITVYTKPLGAGDLGAFYRSRISYEVLSNTDTGMSMLYGKAEPNIGNDSKAIQLVENAGGSDQTVNGYGAEEILYLVLSTDSSEAAGGYDFDLHEFGYTTATEAHYRVFNEASESSTVSFISAGDGYPSYPLEGDEVYVTSDGTSSGTVISRSIYTGSAWVGTHQHYAAEFEEASDVHASSVALSSSNTISAGTAQVVGTIELTPGTWHIYGAACLRMRDNARTELVLTDDAGTTIYAKDINHASDNPSPAQLQYLTAEIDLMNFEVTTTSTYKLWIEKQSGGHAEYRGDETLVNKFTAQKTAKHLPITSPLEAEYLHANITADETVSTGQYVNNFSLLASSGLSLGAFSYVTLKAGVSYKLKTSLNMTSGSSASYLVFRWEDRTNSVLLGNEGFGYPMSQTTAGSQQPTAIAYVTPTTDIEVGIKIVNENGTAIIDSSYGYMTIEAVAKQLPVTEVLTSPNGTKYRMIVANDGTLATEAV